MATTAHADPAFAPVAGADRLVPIGGGKQSVVYRSADRRYVVKLKHDGVPTVGAAMARARAMGAIAEEFAACLGPAHSVPTWHVVARDDAGRARVLTIQPFVAGARPLSAVDYGALSGPERARVAAQLDGIARRARRLYRARGHMPDLHGFSTADAAARARLRLLYRLPRRLSRFVMRQSLLHSHNLLLTDPPECRVVLVDYDLVGRARLARRAFYAARWLLLGVDQLRLARRRRAG
ncbi:MAG: hypothetical protein AVDCRST_MAG18-5014 [uncultured Thermomicrobiales bacterium]|uniref:Aminoglycoside phosphotransferase domain-containing protein n=1 Tax=uncultured Thermomicrobiales bacterium TaxID=1645740 RepID=A0A6N3IPH6_9BACT|nr:MAG: hypothetical protein AVDCRST_MAG18-5014 [uncultured Thermomicrobiales bacterium]